MASLPQPIEQACSSPGSVLSLSVEQRQQGPNALPGRTGDYACRDACALMRQGERQGGEERCEGSVSFLAREYENKEALYI